MPTTEGRVFPDLRPAPETILVFGAASQTGGPLIEHVLKHSSGPTIRLISSNSDTATGLQDRFSSAEVMVALALHSLIDAFIGVDAAYIVTPDFFEYEKRAMCNGRGLPPWSRSSPAEAHRHRTAHQSA